MSGTKKFKYKQILYLTTENVREARALLEQLPGSPSLSSYMDELLESELPRLRRVVEKVKKEK